LPWINAVTGYAKTPVDVDYYYTAQYDALDGHKIQESFYSPTVPATPAAIVVDGNGDVAFVATALPGGNLGRPIFVAKRRGKGITGKNTSASGGG